MSNEFTEIRDRLLAIRELGRVKRNSEKLVMTISAGPEFSDVINKIGRLKQVLYGPDRNDIASSATDLLIERIVARIERDEPGDMEMGIGKSYTNPAIKYKDTIISYFSSKKLMAQGVYGFGDVKKLNTLVLNKRSDSPYGLAWMVYEFGTGMYADKSFFFRPKGYAKVPGGSGAWYLNPAKKGPLLFGSTGSHSIFGARNDIADMQEDMNFVALLVMALIDEKVKGA